MRRKLLPLSLLLVLPFIALTSQAQNTKYDIFFRSGRYLPEQAAEKNFARVFTEDRIFAGKFYVLIQFNEIPDAEIQASLVKDGITLLEYLPNYAYFASAPINLTPAFISKYQVRSLETIDFKFKLDARVNSAREGNEMVITYFRDIPYSSILEDINRRGLHLVSAVPEYNRITLLMPQEGISKLDLPWAMWIEPFHQELVTENFVAGTDHRINMLNSNVGPGRNLKGTGVNIGQWDATGIGNHVDFAGRLINVQGVSGDATHATFVAGNMVGAGIKNPAATGMAPGATLFSWNYNGNVIVKMDSAAKYRGIVITQNSYAYSSASDYCAYRGSYDYNSREFDKMAIKYPQLMQVFAAGNFQAQCGAGGFRTISSGYQASKNVIVVGACNKVDAMTNFSSWGPVADGRLKPDITATGAGILSTGPGDNYIAANGTSYSAPGVSGTLALLVERYRQLNSGNNPDAILMKAIICNSADDLGNPGPDYKFGFGRLNALNAVAAIEENRFLHDSVLQNEIKYDTIYVSSGLQQIKIMLAWSDKEAATNVQPSIVNDLSLQIKHGSITYLPLVLDTANRNASASSGTDSINNMEQIIIDNPTEGYYVLKVSGVKVPFNAQKYVLTYETVSNHITVTYPNGGESMVPPSSNANYQLIRWDAAGITGNFTVDYSIDGGSTWTTISNSVPSNQQFLNWSNSSDSLQTGQARIRVSSGSMQDISDSAFSIMGVTSALNGSVCDRQVFLNWNSVKGASSYNVYLLVNNTWDLKASTTDTFFTVTGLVNNTSSWFTVSANGKSGAYGEKCIAISKTPVNTLSPPVVILQPQDIKACAGSNITLRTKSSGTSSIQIQWQQSADKGISWSDINGATDTLLNIGSVSYQQNNYRFRAMFRNCCMGPVYTRAAILKVDTGQAISEQPMDQLICSGTDAIFRCTVISADSTAIQWKQSFNNGFAWTDINGGRETSLRVSNAASSHNNMLIRMVSTGACGSIVSRDARLGVRTALTVTVTAGSQITSCSGTPVNLTATGSGGDSARYRYDWNGAGTSASITIMPTATAWYKVKLTDSCSGQEAEDSVKITVLSPLAVKASRDTSLCVGQNIILSAAGSGGKSTAYTYTWNPGTQTGNTLPVTAGESIDYIVTLTDNCSGQNASDTVHIDVRPELLILANEDTTICYGQSARISAQAVGGQPDKYAFGWDNNLGSGDNFIVSPQVTTTYRVTVSDKCSPSASDSVTVNVNPPLSITIDNQDSGLSYKVCNGTVISAIGSGGISSSYIYSWTDTNNNVISGGRELTVSNSIPEGTYFVKLNDGCSGEVLKKISISKKQPVSNWTYIPKGLRSVIFKPADSTMSLYKWDFGDDKTSVNLIPTHTFSKYAPYTVCLTTITSAACSSTTCTTIELTPTGIIEKDAPAGDILVYPNPSSGEFEIKINMPQLKNLHICVYNLMGEEVGSTKIIMRDETLYYVNVGQEAAGIYFVHISDNEFTLNKRIIINNIR